LIKLFLKKFALRWLITPDRAFGQAFRWKGCDQTFFEKVCDQAFFKKSLLLIEFYKVTYLKDS
jgi:hypothetical protein